MKRRQGFTLIEMLVGFFIAMFILSAFYMMHGTYQRRLIKILQKTKGQQAVRLFLTKIRQELKSATAVYIPLAELPDQYKDFPHVYDGPRDDVLIMAFGRSEIHDHPGFTIKYEYDQDSKSIRFSEYKNHNQLLRQGTFLGGNTQILGFHAHQTDMNEQILIQKFKVDVEIDYFDATGESKEKNNKTIAHSKANLTVYPRHVNVMLRIDVPQ